MLWSARSSSFARPSRKTRQPGTAASVVRLAVERLWITAGNLAEVYRIERGVTTGVEPWSELVGYRHLLAHALPGDISSDRVFADTIADLERILSAVHAQLAG